MYTGKTSFLTLFYKYLMVIINTSTVLPGLDSGKNILLTSLLETV